MSRGHAATPTAMLTISLRSNERRDRKLLWPHGDTSRNELLFSRRFAFNEAAFSLRTKIRNRKFFSARAMTSKIFRNDKKAKRGEKAIEEEKNLCLVRGRCGVNVEWLLAPWESLMLATHQRWSNPHVNSCSFLEKCKTQTMGKTRAEEKK